MERELGRRSFLRVAALAVAGGAAQTEAGDCLGRPLRMDGHVHLMGVGDTDSGIYIGPAFRRKWFYHPGLVKARLQYVQTFGHCPESMDDAFAELLAHTIRNSCVDRALVIGGDARYGCDGCPDWEGTTVYIPNDYLLSVTARYCDVMVPCVGINPDRPDALAELERCVCRGARVLKIYPPYQGVELMDPRHIPFYRRCAEWGVIIMVHTGYSETHQTLPFEYADPNRLVLMLEQGCTVVAAHCGTCAWYRRQTYLPDFQRLIRRYPNLYGDSAGLARRPRAPDFRELLEDECTVSRLLYGSDWPVTPTPLAFRRDVGWEEALRAQLVGNEMARDFAVQNALGVAVPAAERAARLYCRS